MWNLSLSAFDMGIVQITRERLVFTVLKLFSLKNNHIFPARRELKKNDKIHQSQILRNTFQLIKNAETPNTGTTQEKYVFLARRKSKKNNET